MLKRLLAHVAPLPVPSPQPEIDQQQDKEALEAHAFLSAVAAAMPRINLPNAANDDPMESVHKVVEYALAQSGYLR